MCLYLMLFCESAAHLLERHPEGAHVDVGGYSACVKVTAAAQNDSWREGKDVCQTARQLWLYEMSSFFSNFVTKQ